MQRRAITILTCMLSANHWYAKDKFYRGKNSYDTGLNLAETSSLVGRGLEPQYSRPNVHLYTCML